MMGVSTTALRESCRRISCGASTYASEAQLLGISRRRLHSRLREIGCPSIGQRELYARRARLAHEALEARDAVGAAWLRRGETLAEAIENKTRLLESMIQADAE